jgi:hypothetical protein
MLDRIAGRQDRGAKGTTRRSWPGTESLDRPKKEVSNGRTMTFEEVAKHFRWNIAPLSVGQIIIVTNDGDFSGRGRISAIDGKLELAVILDGERELPRIGSSTTRDKFWKIGCIIEEHAPVWTLGIAGRRNTHREAQHFTSSACFDLDIVHHLTVPLGEYGREAVMTAAGDPDPGEDPHEQAYAFARLVNHKLMWHNLYSQTVQENGFLIQRDTLRGAFDEFEYALIKRGEDCEVHLRLKKGAVISPRIFRNTFSALLRAVAFLHGQHAWPQWERVETGSRVLDEFATAPRNVPKTIHTLLTETACAYNADPTSLIEKAVHTFVRTDEFSRSLEDYIFLAREAGAKETPLQVGTLSLCATFEGLVGLLHKQLCESESSAHIAEFREARAILMRHIEEQRTCAASEQKSVIAWERLGGILASAHPFRIADRYRQLAKHFQLPWEDNMAKALDSWNGQRHRLAHGAPQDDANLEDVFHQSRIAGAINVMIGATLGYSGLAVLSPIEDQYITLQ